VNPSKTRGALLWKVSRAPGHFSADARAQPKGAERTFEWPNRPMHLEQALLIMPLLLSQSATPLSFFRSELQMVVFLSVGKQTKAGMLNGRCTWGQFFIYPGFNGSNPDGMMYLHHSGVERSRLEYARKTGDERKKGRIHYTFNKYGKEGETDRLGVRTIVGLP